MSCNELLKILYLKVFYRKRNAVLCLLVICPFLLSCENQSVDKVFDNYLYRLSNSLEQDGFDAVLLEQHLSTPLRRYPSRRQLIYELPATNINLIEFLKLSSCELQRHIGQRNSSLGRFMKESQTLLYNYRFIELAEQCLNQLLNKGNGSPENQELYNILSATIATKQNQLDRIRWNAVFASKEFSTLFSLGAQPLTIEEAREKPGELYLALEKIYRFVNEPTKDIESVENAYGVIASSKRIGELRLSMRYVVSYLLVADQLLQKRLVEKPLCYKNRPNKKFTVVQTVFTKFYIGEVQVYIAKIHQQTKTLLEKIERLKKESVTKPEFNIFWEQVFKNENSEWQLFNQSVLKHTKQWQKLLAQCGSMPS